MLLLSPLVLLLLEVEVPLLVLFPLANAGTVEQVVAVDVGSSAIVAATEGIGVVAYDRSAGMS